jgi:hypothetical protein
MLTSMAVATTDGDTSLHNPVFVVGTTTTGFGAAGDEHEVAKKASPAAATKCRLEKRDRTARTLHTLSRFSIGATRDSVQP